jgi:hypothetical protein
MLGPFIGHRRKDNEFRIRALFLNTNLHTYSDSSLNLIFIHHCLYLRSKYSLSRFDLNIIQQARSCEAWVSASRGTTRSVGDSLKSELESLGSNFRMDGQTSYIKNISDRLLSTEDSFLWLHKAPERSRFVEFP